MKLENRFTRDLRLRRQFETYLIKFAAARKEETNQITDQSLHTIDAFVYSQALTRWHQEHSSSKWLPSSP
jgi:hypothetical protein